MSGSAHPGRVNRLHPVPVGFRRDGNKSKRAEGSQQSPLNKERSHGEQSTGKPKGATSTDWPGQEQRKSEQTLPRHVTETTENTDPIEKQIP